jgi:NAD(P)H-hydrate epimerase
MGGNLRVLREGESLNAHVGDVVVDALFGLGLSRAPEGLSQSAIDAILVARERGAKVVSVDLPSGLSSDNGRPPGACVEADVTVTLGYIKRGLSVEPGCSLAGKLVVADISIPRSAESRLKGKAVFVLTEGGIRAILPERMPESHKGHYGHVLVVAGSPGKSGAASMTAAGALRGGAGLVTLASREPDVRSAQTFMPEMMAHFLRGEGPLGHDDVPGLLEACDGKTVLAIGPGLYRGPETGAAILRLLADAKLPAVLDADALNAIAEAREPFPHGAPLILTPHPGEMARLAEVSADEVQNDRIGTARRYADEHKVTVVLKGARTVIADVTGATAINPTGNPGMATAGSGDVLTGLCAALVAQGLTAGSAACAAVFVHGRAGDLASARHGAKGLVATDLLAGITDVWASWGL